MSTTAFEPRVAHGRDTVEDDATGAHRDLTDLGRRMRRLEDLVVDPLDDAVRTLRRTMRGARRRVQDASDFKAATAYRVKRSPITAIGLAFGAGLLMAGTVAWVSQYAPSLARTESSSSEPDLCEGEDVVL